LFNEFACFEGEDNVVSRRQFIKLCSSTIAALSVTEILNQTVTSSNVAVRYIPVLLYHRVGYTQGYLTITPERFTADLEYLKDRGYQAVSLEKFQNFMLDRDVQMPDKPVLITFDDGYLDNYQNAFSILTQYGMTASFFIISGMLWDENRMTPRHIAEMAQAGMSFGSHTVTHRSLGELSEDEIRTELSDSKITLESILGTPVSSIAYPKGSFSQATVKIAEELGYIGGFTTISGRCSKDMPDFVLKRIPIFSYDADLGKILAERG
jgi:peptidoglycan/xylan/chitin deacetylase (PgdA/CDA1 family)